MFWLRPFFALITLIISLFIFVAPVKAEESSPPKDLQIKVEMPDTSQYPTVTVTVTVADKSGAPIFGLHPTLFSLSIEGKPVLTVTGEALEDSSPEPLNLVLALDRSFRPEVGYQWDELKQLATTVQQSMKKDSKLKFIVFDSEVHKPQNLQELQTFTVDYTKTALNRAIEHSTNLVTRMSTQDAIEKQSQIIVIANSADNTSRLPIPPPTFERLRKELITDNTRVKPELHVYCFGVGLPVFESPYSKSLRTLAQDSGATGNLVITSTIEQVASDVGQLLQTWQGPARYKFTFRTDLKVKQTYNLQVQLASQSSNMEPFTPTLPSIAIAIDAKDQDRSEKQDTIELIVPKQPSQLTFAVTNDSKMAPLTTQVRLNDVLSSTYSFNDPQNQLQLTKLVPNVQYTLNISMTDSIGNSGSKSKIFKIAQPIDVDIEPKVSATYAVSRSTLADLVYTVTARGESPITVTFLVSSTNATKFITEMHDIGNAVSFTIGAPLADFISKTYSETYVYAQPECPSNQTTLQNLATRLPESLQPPVARFLSWGEPLRCILPTHRTIWTNLMTAQLPLTDTFKLSIDAKDRVGQQSSYVGDPINFTISYATPPTLIRRLAYYWFVFLLDILALLLLLLFGFWLHRRFVLAHEMTYDLRIVNAGNLATRYELCALQSIAKSRGLLSFQPDTLLFSFLYNGKTLEQMPTSAQKLTVSMPLTSQDVVTLDDKTLQTAQQVSRIDDRQSQYEIHEKLWMQSGEQPYAMTLGYSPHFQTELVAPGDSLPLQLKIQTHRRHWWRKSYTFVIVSQPQVADSEWQKTTASQTIRFGNILSPKRIDKLPSRQNTDSSSTSAIGSPIAVNSSGN